MFAAIASASKPDGQAKLPANVIADRIGVRALSRAPPVFSERAA